MRAFVSILVVAAGLATEASAVEIAKRYSYFSIGGTTLDQIEKELYRRGPKIDMGNDRHPGATRMEFNTRLVFEETASRCRISEAKVTLRAKIMLPRWHRSRSASTETITVWDTLAADIKRHEESHVSIAKNHARDLETALGRLTSRKGCKQLQAMVDTTTERVMAAHDREQERFDRIEGMNFEKRMIRLLRYNIQRKAR